MRQEVDKKGPHAEEISKIQKEGGLVSSDVLCKLIKSSLESQPNTAKFLLDGFPRSQENVDAWDKIIGNSVEVSALLYLKCSSETLTKRLIGRGENRSDDNPETIKKRIDVFLSRTIPMIEKFKDKVIEIDGEPTVDEVYKNVKQAFENKGLTK